MSARLVDALIKAPFFVASKSHCPFCARAKSLLAAHNVRATIIELDSRPDGQAIQSALAARTNQATVPYIFAGGRFIGGYSDLAKQPQSFWSGVKRE